MFEEWAKRDPIERFRGWLRENAALTDDEETRSRERQKLLADAINRADESPLPHPSTLTEAPSRRPKTSTRPTRES
jgi:TPP-dependent pyruvate/acetoin dehydrogenase alpha subunit